MAQLIACASVIAAVVLLAQYLQELKAGSLSSTSTTLNTTGVAGEVITAGGAKVKFSDFDTDKDGAIEVAEVPAALRALGIPDTDATAKEVIKKADASGDNVVTLSEFQALISAIEGEQPLLPWWAYALIMVGVIGIALLVAYFAWKKGNWMTLLVAAIVGSSTIAALEGFLYGSPVLGGYMVLASIGALALFLIARWMKRTFVDPVAKRLGDAVEAVQGMRESARDMHKSASEYIGSMSVKGAVGGLASAGATAIRTGVETAGTVIDDATKTGMKALGHVAAAAAAMENGGVTPPTVAQEKGKELSDLENGVNFGGVPTPGIKPVLEKAGSVLEKAGSGLVNLLPGGDALPFNPNEVDMSDVETEAQREQRSAAKWKNGKFIGQSLQEQPAPKSWSFW